MFVYYVGVTIVCCFLLFDYVFFFKQKTAYEMRISDWSSDVCSSDLFRCRSARIYDMDNIPAILKVDSGGMPVSWIHWHTAVTLYARELVRWEAGDERFLILGGTNARTGLRSSCRIGSIIAVADRSRRHGSGVPLLTKR